ncbi:fatty acid hydroxylase [Daedaleopsis nitida]|nr:fatty acid hydroxylase [Daedaleopsis nitida]
MTTPIPVPPAIPFLGHVTSIDPVLPLRSIDLLAKQYGEIYELRILSHSRFIVTSYEMLDEVSDDKRFRKIVSGPLEVLRSAAGDGLFTAHVPGEQNWYIAHRLLMPCFGTANVYNMFNGMMDITSQLILKWQRFGPRDTIDPAADFTRLTLDAISLCAMSYRLNSFYRENPHPFAEAMSDFLIESERRSRRFSIVQAMMSSANARYQHDIDTMNALVDEILNDHRNNHSEKQDLVDVMLTGRDKETGLGLSEENIKCNLLTFLIAGHETTSGMLTFTVYFLLKNPEALRKLREEIDTKIGDRPMTVQDVNKLPYLLAVMRESMRLGPTAPLRQVAPLEDTVLAGKYSVKRDTPMLVNIYGSQRDPKLWGEDADKFIPERMLDGKFESLPPNAWQPFGFGMRACIVSTERPCRVCTHYNSSPQGRPFAWQEAQVALVTVLQHFDLLMHDPTYELELKQTLTIKPHKFFIHAVPRKGKHSLLAPPSSMLLSGGDPASTSHSRTTTTASVAGGVSPLYVLYGSNTGTSESLAQRLASVAPAYGFKASLGTLDSASGHIPTDGPVLIVTASFEGQPADNARHFVENLENAQGDTYSGLKFAVFGCGNRDWVNTYQRIPTLIDSLLEQRGGSRIVTRGEGDAADAAFFGSFDQWENTVWEALSKDYGHSAAAADANALEVKTISSGTSRADILRQPDTALGTVVENRVLTAPGAPPKRHIEFGLPEGMTYRTGDYLAILPVNPDRLVRRAIARLGLPVEQEVEINTSAPTTLPVKKPISIYNLLSGYIELQQPATTRDLDALVKMTASPKSTQAIKDLIASYADTVFKRRLSVLDILEENGDIDISFSAFLKMLPPMRIRQYSISSSPLWNANRVSLTISVVDAPPLSGRDEPYLGVASTYLAGLRAGDKVQLSVRASNAAFHPPADPTVPLVMICAGSGLAPMRGFLQERAMQKLAGREVAQSLLFFGCRTPEDDFLYGDSDLEEWSKLGVVDIRPAFSRSSADSVDCRYVQHRLSHDREDVIKAFDAGAKIFVCGSSKIATAVKQTIVDFIKESKGVDDAAALGEIMNGRYATDIFE